MKLSTLGKSIKSLIDKNANVSQWEIKGINDAVGYLDLLKSNSSNFLWDHINDFNLKNVLEIGCNSGSRLFSGAKKFDQTNFVGSDINSNSITVAKNFAKENNYLNTKFMVNDLRDIDKLFEELGITEFDLIYTWATLIYIHPIYIEKILIKLIEKTRTLILIEQHDKRINLMYRGKPTSGGRNYVRNYEKILYKIGIKIDQISIIDVPEFIWKPGGGYAKLIEIKNL